MNLARLLQHLALHHRIYSAGIGQAALNLLLVAFICLMLVGYGMFYRIRDAAQKRPAVHRPPQIDAEAREELKTTVAFWLAFAILPFVALVVTAARVISNLVASDVKRRLRTAERLAGGKTTG